jgi:aerobic-type carbon monoxide dehydrogenase small subunit (CoxS/CutS family)
MPPELLVDGQPLSDPSPARPGETLLQLLRRTGHTAPKEACGRGECGACTVLVDGRAVLACVQLAGLVSGEVTTAAGLGPAGDRLRAAFADHAAFQCGFCTPGQVVRGAAVLNECPSPTREHVVAAMSGTNCRCTGYVQIVDAIMAAAPTAAATPPDGAPQ